MKYIIADETEIWDLNSKKLRRLGKDIIVISFGTCSNTIPSVYTRIDIDVDTDSDPYCLDGLGSERYHKLQDQIGTITELISDDDVLCLTDSSIASLLPYKALQSVDYKCFKLHLWSISPLPFVSGEKKLIHKALLGDLRDTVSVIHMESPYYLHGDNIPKTSWSGILNEKRKDCEKIMDEVVLEIEWMADSGNEVEKYYFDWEEGKYRNVGTNEIQRPVESLLQVGLMGIPRLQDYIAKKDRLVQPAPRVDGHHLCDDLKKARDEIARLNNLDYHSTTCSYSGPCAGTCPKCDEEAEYIRQELEKIPENQRKYPYLDIIKSSNGDFHLNTYEKKPGNLICGETPGVSWSIYMEDSNE